MENRKWLVLDRSDFGRNFSLSFSTDLLDSEAEADDCATQMVRDDYNDVYMFRLERIYRPMPDEESRQVEIVFIEPEDEGFNPSRDDPYGKLQYGWLDLDTDNFAAGSHGSGGNSSPSITLTSDTTIYTNGYRVYFNSDADQIFNFGGTE